jgi:hypothetical protein
MAPLPLEIESNLNIEVSARRIAPFAEAAYRQTHGTATQSASRAHAQFS